MNVHMPRENKLGFVYFLTYFTAKLAGIIMNVHMRFKISFTFKNFFTYSTAKVTDVGVKPHMLCEVSSSFVTFTAFFTFKVARLVVYDHMPGKMRLFRKVFITNCAFREIIFGNVIIFILFLKSKIDVNLLQNHYRFRLILLVYLCSEVTRMLIR